MAVPRTLRPGVSAPIAAVVLLLFVPIAASALDWNRFRGPNGSGVANGAGLPADLSERDIRWKTPLPGKGHSSPVIANGRIFLTCTPPETARRIMVAVDAATGKIAWSRDWETAAFRQHSDNSYTSASPVADAERVYLWWSSPEQSWLAALDQKDGREIWKKELGSFVAQHGAGSSPIVVGDTVILDFEQESGTNSYTLCVDARTGTEKWKTSRESDSSTASTPCLYQPAGGGAAQLILISRTTGVSALDPKTGKVIWDLPKILPKRCVASPVVTDSGLIIAQCGEGQAESFVYAVRPGANGAPPEKAYEVIRTGGYVPSPLAVGKLLFLWKENGLVTCLRADTNEQLWSERVEGPFYGSPICVDGKLYNATRRGDLVVLAAAEQYKLISRIPLGEGSFATPAVAPGNLYIRTFSHLIALGK